MRFMYRPFLWAGGISVYPFTPLSGLKKRMGGDNGEGEAATRYPDSSLLASPHCTTNASKHRDRSCC
jgi:hypothetical protein